MATFAVESYADIYRQACEQFPAISKEFYQEGDMTALPAQLRDLPDKFQHQLERLHAAADYMKSSYEGLKARFARRESDAAEHAQYAYDKKQLDKEFTAIRKKQIGQFEELFKTANTAYEHIATRRDRSYGGYGLGFVASATAGDLVNAGLREKGILLEGMGVA